MNDETINELRRLLPLLMKGDFEDDQGMIFARIADLSPDPEWSDHILHSDELTNALGEVDVERVIAKMAAYRPIIL